MTAPEITELRKRLGIARWTLSAGLYGTSQSIRAQKRCLRRALRHLGRLEFLGKEKVELIRRYVKFTHSLAPASPVRRALESLPGLIMKKPLEVIEAVPHVDGLMQGIPTEFFVRHAYFKMDARPDSAIDPARDGCGVIWFAPIVPNRAEDIVRALETGRSCYDRFGFEFHVALIFQNPRSAIVLMSIFYFRDVESERARAQNLEMELARSCRAVGYHEYRTGLSNMATLYEQDPAYAGLLRRLKDAIDPDGILSPARYGLRDSGGVRDT
jgi:4-cresol dehydrogenase (hydroxylating)